MTATHEWWAVGGLGQTVAIDPVSVTHKNDGLRRCSQGTLEACVAASLLALILQRILLALLLALLALLLALALHLLAVFYLAFIGVCAAPALVFGQHRRRRRRWRQRIAQVAGLLALFLLLGPAWCAVVGGCAHTDDQSGGCRRLEHSIVARGRSPKTAMYRLYACAHVYKRAADGLQCREAILRG